MVDADTVGHACVYEGSGPLTNMGTLRLAGMEQRVEQLEKRRVTGITFPSIFKPPRPTCTPAGIFLPTGMGNQETVLFVGRDGKRKVLVYTDGACTNNGQANPRAGWAVVYGHPDLMKVIVPMWCPAPSKTKGHLETIVSQQATELSYGQPSLHSAFATGVVRDSRALSLQLIHPTWLMVPLVGAKTGCATDGRRAPAIM